MGPFKTLNWVTNLETGKKFGTQTIEQQDNRKSILVKIRKDGKHFELHEVFEDTGSPKKMEIASKLAVMKTPRQLIEKAGLTCSSENQVEVMAYSKGSECERRRFLHNNSDFDFATLCEIPEDVLTQNFTDLENDFNETITFPEFTVSK